MVILHGRRYYGLWLKSTPANGAFAACFRGQECPRYMKLIFSFALDDFAGGLGDVRSGEGIFFG